VAVPKITFLPSGVSREFAAHTLPYKEHGKPGSILDCALNFGVHIEHTCGGNCACTTCHVIIRAGEKNLSPMDDFEADRLDMAQGLTLHSRLACQAVVRGDVVVEIP
jgi:ferredoxin, 2Fe-2S